MICAQDKFDLLVVPGGATGAATISNDPSCQKLVKEYLDKGKHVGMICAGAKPVMVGLNTSINYYDRVTCRTYFDTF